MVPRGGGGGANARSRGEDPTERPIDRAREARGDAQPRHEHVREPSLLVQEPPEHRRLLELGAARRHPGDPAEADRVGAGASEARVAMCVILPRLPVRPDRPAASW